MRKALSCLHAMRLRKAVTVVLMWQARVPTSYARLCTEASKACEQPVKSAVPIFAEEAERLWF